MRISFGRALCAGHLRAPADHAPDTALTLPNQCIFGI